MNIMHFLRKITCRATKACILKYIQLSVANQRMISLIMSRNQSQVFIAWNDRQGKWQLTYNKQLFKTSRLASLEEVLGNTHHLNSFTKEEYNRVLILSDGLFQLTWEVENDCFGAEQYLYLVDIFNEKTKHLIAVIPVF